MTQQQEWARLIAILAAAEAAMPPSRTDHIVEEKWRSRLAKGEPALAAEDFPAVEAAALLAAVLKAEKGLVVSQQQSQALLADYLAEGMTADAWSQYDTQLEQGLLYCHLACQAALAWLGRRVAAAALLTEWTGQRCPVCGAGPSFAALTKEGQRELICGACLTQWPYQGCGCVFCGESEADKLRILASRELPGWSAGVCVACRSYLKTADVQQLGGWPDWQQAAVTTLPLDYGVSQWLESATASKKEKNLRKH